MKKKIVKYHKAPLKDFKCSCGCGQKLRVVYHTWKNGYLIDFGFMKGKENKPKIGVVLRSDEKNSLKDFIKFLPKIVLPPSLKCHRLEGETLL